MFKLFSSINPLITSIIWLAQSLYFLSKSWFNNSWTYKNPFLLIMLAIFSTNAANSFVSFMQYDSINSLKRGLLSIRLLNISSIYSQLLTLINSSGIIVTSQETFNLSKYFFTKFNWYESKVQISALSTFITKCFVLSFSESFCLILSFISLLASLVKVNTNNWSKLTLLSMMFVTILWVRTLVLPLPAPAVTATLPWLEFIAFCCWLVKLIIF